MATELRVLAAPREIVDSTPWEMVLEAFLGAVANSPQTVRNYRRHCEAACEYLAIRSLAELNGAMLAEYRAHIVTNRRLAPGSRAVALTAFRSFVKWSWAIGAHQMDERVVRVTLKGIRATVKIPYVILSESDTLKVWTAARKDPRDLALLSICLGAGLRTSEIAHLRVGDCYQDMEGGPALHVRQGKGGKDRIVPMREEFFRGVLAYLEDSGRTLDSAGWLFHARDPGAAARESQLSSEGTGILVSKILTRAAVRQPRMSVHSLRHMYAIGVLRSSGNLIAVQALLGHANVGTTMRYLDHLRLGDLRELLPPMPLADGPST